MAITTTIQQKKSININVPCFFEDSTIKGITKAIAVLGDQDIISIFHSDTRTNMSSDVVSSQGSTIVEAIETWESITEERFMEIHAEAMKKLSLVPIVSDITQNLYASPKIQ